MMKIFKIILIICLIFIIYILFFNFNSFKNQKLKIKILNSNLSDTTSNLIHQGISIDESNLNDNVEFLTFNVLESWQFDTNKNTNPPKQISDLNNKRFKIVGFMYPLEEGKEIKNFCLLKSTQTCCYGPKPSYNQYVLVEMKNKVKFERFKPVIIDGIFYVDPKPNEGYIYRMDGLNLEVYHEENTIKNDNLQIDTSKYILFNFSLIESFIKKLEGRKSTSINENDFEFFKDYKNKQILVSGYFVGILPHIQNCILIGQNYWDGCCTGTPPTILNSIPVKLKFDEKPPLFFGEEVSYIGEFKINTNVSRWYYDGIIYIDNSFKVKIDNNNLKSINY